MQSRRRVDNVDPVPLTSDVHVLALTSSSDDDDVDHDAVVDTNERKEKMNGNVFWILVFTGLSGLADGIWSSAVLSAYLDLITRNNNFDIGVSEGIQGAMQCGT
jgi:hypothetical protein